MVMREAKSGRRKDRGAAEVTKHNRLARAWLVAIYPFLPSKEIDAHVRRSWFHLYPDGDEQSACGNHQRPLFSVTIQGAPTGDDAEKYRPCARCIEAFTANGKPAPEFP